MTIRPKRKAMSLQTKLDAALIALGLDPDDTEYDHTPALELRPLNASGTDTDPPANDPRYIVPRTREGHARKTFGSPFLPRSGDLSQIAHTKRLERKRGEHDLAMQVKLLGADSLLPDWKPRQKFRWPKRKFETRKK